MSTAIHIPVDSADARELREAEAAQSAETAEQEAAAAQARADQLRDHAERCRRGWLGEDDEDRPIPCPVCRPWLLEVACWTCGAPPVACQIRGRVRRGPCCPDCDHRPHRPAAA